MLDLITDIRSDNDQWQSVVTCLLEELLKTKNDLKWIFLWDEPATIATLTEIGIRKDIEPYLKITVKLGEIEE